jgi:thiol-disulfide isomerase/thioredoxin
LRVKRSATGGSRIWRATALLMLLLAGPALAAEAVRGRVVDAAGEPVAGAEVGTSFALAGSLAETRVQISYGGPPVVCDATGSFSIPAAPIGYTHMLVAKGRDGMMGYAIRQDSAPARIILQLPAHLTIQVSKSFGEQHPWGVDFATNGATAGYATVTAQPAVLLVPQGRLEVWVSDAESSARGQIAVTASQPASLRLELQPVWWFRNKGEPAPAISPTDIRNWPAGQPFTAPKRKWVLVSYWATWCKPCVEEMPKLIDFYQQHAALRDRFEILAIHSADGASFVAIGDQYERLVKMWGQPVPFPLLFDSTGATHKRWGIQSYPTMLLIDPEGNLAGAGNLEILATKLGIRHQARGIPPK